jgi:prepilin-type N-terminal cleavage/methylation domain-containing protein
MTRRGFTLVEMMVALVILSLVAAGLSGIFKSQQRMAVTQVEQASLQANVRSASQILSGELRSLASSPTGVSDIISMTPTSLQYRAMRSVMLACQITRTQITIRDDPTWGPRPIIVGQDSLFVFAENDPILQRDDKWVAAPINSVSNGGNCPDGASATYISTDLDTLQAPISAYVADAPVRTFEVMEVGPVTVGGQSWLGARSVSGGAASLTPVIGPITATGLSLVYLDSLGNVTGTASRIRSIQVALRGQTDRNVRTFNNQLVAQPLQDSLVSLVTLRNTPVP